MSKRLTAIIRSMIPIIALLTLAALFIPIPFTRIDDAVEIKLDAPSCLVPFRVEIRGFYHWNIFKDDTFEGQITVPDYVMAYLKMSNVAVSVEGDPIEYAISGYDGMLVWCAKQPI